MQEDQSIYQTPKNSLVNLKDSNSSSWLRGETKLKPEITSESHFTVKNNSFSKRNNLLNHNIGHKLASIIVPQGQINKHNALLLINVTLPLGISSKTSTYKIGPHSPPTPKKVKSRTKLLKVIVLISNVRDDNSVSTMPQTKVNPIYERITHFLKYCKRKNRKLASLSRAENRIVFIPGFFRGNTVTNIGLVKQVLIGDRKI